MKAFLAAIVRAINVTTLFGVESGLFGDQ